MSLSNHAGNLIVLGEFEEAFLFAQKAINRFNEFTKVLFPNIEARRNSLIDRCSVVFTIATTTN